MTTSHQTLWKFALVEMKRAEFEDENFDQKRVGM